MPHQSAAKEAFGALERKAGQVGNLQRREKLGSCPAFGVEYDAALGSVHRKGLQEIRTIKEDRGKWVPPESGPGFCSCRRCNTW